MQEFINRTPTDWQQFMQQARPSANIAAQPMTEEELNAIPYDRLASNARVGSPYYDPRANLREIQRSPPLNDPMVRALYSQPPGETNPYYVQAPRGPVTAPKGEVDADRERTIRRALSLSPPYVP
jgi:hypothetical protein